MKNPCPQANKWLKYEKQMHERFKLYYSLRVKLAVD